MAGSPTLGKMSTGIRRAARNAKSARETNATTTVTGRPSEARTKRMFHFLWKSLAGLGDEWLNVSRGGSDSEQPAPDTETGKRIVNLGLREQPLRFRDLIDIPQ